MSVEMVIYILGSPEGDVGTKSTKRYVLHASCAVPPRPFRVLERVRARHEHTSPRTKWHCRKDTGVGESYLSVEVGEAPTKPRTERIKLGDGVQPPWLGTNQSPLPPMKKYQTRENDPLREAFEHRVVEVADDASVKR
ncbi:hypothetical protein K0M31_020085, partial [Melipona bicolor]